MELVPASTPNELTSATGLTICELPLAVVRLSPAMIVPPLMLKIPVVTLDERPKGSLALIYTVPSVRVKPPSLMVVDEFMVSEPSVSSTSVKKKPLLEAG